MSDKRVSIVYQIREDEENWNKAEISSPSFNDVMALTHETELPVDQEWKMTLSLFGMGKPIRFFYGYKPDNEDITITEQNHSGRARHNVPALSMGGPYPIHSLVNVILDYHSFQEWMSW